MDSGGFLKNIGPSPPSWVKCLVIEQYVLYLKSQKGLTHDNRQPDSNSLSFVAAYSWPLPYCQPCRRGQGRALPPAEPAKSIAAALQPFVDDHSLAGAVALVANSEKVLSVEAVGFADVASAKPMRPDALFWIASQSKPMTATAVLMRCSVDEAQRLASTTPSQNTCRNSTTYGSPSSKTRIMCCSKSRSTTSPVRQILSHTSGMAFSSAMEEPTLDLLRLRDAVRSYAMTPLQFEPGSKYQYSNAGINTAARIIEVVSGMPYEEFMETRLFAPLGMKDTTFWPNEMQLARLAKSYKPNAAKSDLEETTITQLKYPLDERKRQPMPAGGLFSTASDVARFCQMILNTGVYNGKRYLSEAAVAQMTSKQTGDGIKDGYGLGWSTGGGTFGHGGAYSTGMTIDPKRRLITVFMVQHAGFPKHGDKSQEAFKQAAYGQF